MTSGGPPKLAVRIIERMLPPDEREDTLGDLSERFHLKSEVCGSGPARRWVWRQAFGFASRLTIEWLNPLFGLKTSQARGSLGARIRCSALSTFVTDDLRFSMRSLRKQPLFAVVAIVTLALGIGANTAVFSVVNGVLLRPLPFPDPDRLVGVWHTAPGWGFDGYLNQSPGTYYTYREETRVFEDIGMWLSYPTTVTGLDRPERVVAVFLTDGTLPVIGVSPFLGRTFTAADDLPDAAPTVVLSHGYWQTRFGFDSSVVGRAITIDGQPSEIIGVMPPGFDFFQTNPALYLPFRYDRSRATVFGNFSYYGVARLKLGVTIEQANADVARMIPLALEKFPAGMSPADIENVQLGPDVHPVKTDLVGDVTVTLWIILGTVGIVLIVACANVANLFLVRAEGRRTEIAVRTAVGAGRSRLARLFFAESLTLAALGGGLGVGIAYLGIDAFLAVGSRHLPRITEIAIDSDSLLFATAVTVVSSIFFGLLPLIRFGTANLGAPLKDGGRGAIGGRRRQRVRSVLVVLQMALAFVLVTGSGLMIRSFRAMRLVHPGFERPHEVLSMTIAPGEHEASSAEATAATHESILRRIRAIPGILAAGFTSSITMDGRGSNQGVHVEEFPIAEDETAPIRRFKWISPGYFEVLRNPLLAGRSFTWEDVHERAKVVVVTENFATEYWGTPTEAIGKRIREGREQPWREIIGVVGNVHDDGANRPATAVVYWPPIVEDFWGRDVFARVIMVYAVRSARGDETALMDEVRQGVWAVSSALPVANVQTLQTIYNRSLTLTSFTMALLSVAALMALVIGTTGIYGVISYLVSQRTREIGVRIALGARQQDVGRMVVKHGLAVACLGVLVGLTSAAGLTRLMSALLFEVSPVDPLTYGLVSASLVVAALLACYLPARRAATVDPINALRAD